MQMCVTKLDAARRQLETAIQLYASNCDPISTHTLCCAAYNVVHALNKGHHNPTGLNKSMMLKDFDQFLTSKQDKKVFHDAMNESANFFKHANSDADATHTFDTDYTEVLLADAVQKYVVLVGEGSKEMLTYFCWFVLRHPDIANPDEMPRVREVIDTCRGVLLSDGREKFFQYVSSRAAPFKI